MAQPPGYPKKAFAFIQFYIVVEDGREVPIHDHDVVLGLTESDQLAELVLSKMKEKGGIIRSSIQSMPSALLEMMEQPEPETALNDLLEIADASVRNED